MSHEITTDDSVLLRKEKAWHGLGNVIEDDLTAVEACRAAKLDWEVEGWQLQAINPVTGEPVLLETHVANVRQIVTPEGDIPSILGVVGKGYQRCQNLELADFVDALEQTGSVVTETCGSLKGGKNVWFLLRGDSYSFGDDLSHRYLLAANAHDGSRSIELTPTDIRVVCKNTLSAVLGDINVGDFKPAAIRLRHSGSIASKLDEARKAIREYQQTVARATELYASLADREISDDDAIAFFSGQYAASFTAWGGTSDKVDLRRRDRQDRAAALYLSRFREESAKFGGPSAWLALNAWTGYCQHDQRARGKTDRSAEEQRISSNLFGVNARRSQGAIAGAAAAFLAA